MLCMDPAFSSLDPYTENLGRNRNESNPRLEKIFANRGNPFSTAVFHKFAKSKCNRHAAFELGLFWLRFLNTSGM